MQKVIKKLKNDIHIVIHLGDLCDDISPISSFYDKIEFYSIKGNCDYNPSTPSDKIIMANGKKIFLTHGHTYNVKYGNTKIFYAALEKEVDICLFGHTHSPALFNEENILFMNPGSISIPRGIEFPSYGIIDINANGAIGAAITGVYNNDMYRVIMSL